MKEIVIKIKDFSFSIGKNNIINDISFNVNKGEYLSIVGPNGAGKSTLLKYMMRIFTGGKGTIKIAEKPLHDYKQRELSKLISYVPQANGQNVPFNVYEFVMMGRYPYLSPFQSAGKEDKYMVQKALKLTNTAKLAERLMNTLSGGERQKVFIAAALAQESKILLLDEPTTFLDPKHKDDIHALLKHINTSTGITIISITHDINSAAMTSTRVIALKDGSIVFNGLPDDFMDNDTLYKIYEKKFLFVKHPETGKSIAVTE